MLLALTFGELLEFLSDELPQFLRVVDRLNHVVNCVLEPLNIKFILANPVSVARNHLSHLVLACSQVRHREPKLAVDYVERPQLVVHFVRFYFEPLNFFLSRRNLIFEFFDLVVKYKFELLKFLSLFLQRVDSVFFLADLGVFLVDQSVLLSDLVPQLLNVGFLGLELVAAVLYLPLVKLDFRIHLNQASLGYLVLCFRLQTHVLDVSQVARVFLLDLVVLSVSVTRYLLQDFAVVASLVLYLGDKVLNLFIVLFDIKRVLLSNFLHLRLMFRQLPLMCLNKPCLGHFLLHDKFLVPRSFLQHPLVVFIPLIFQLFMLLFLH